MGKKEISSVRKMTVERNKTKRKTREKSVDRKDKNELSFRENG